MRNILLIIFITFVLIFLIYVITSKLVLKNINTKSQEIPTSKNFVSNIRKKPYYYQQKQQHKFPNRLKYTTLHQIPKHIVSKVEQEISYIPYGITKKPKIEIISDEMSSRLKKLRGQLPICVSQHRLWKTNVM